MELKDWEFSLDSEVNTLILVSYTLTKPMTPQENHMTILISVFPSKLEGQHLLTMEYADE